MPSHRAGRTALAATFRGSSRSSPALRLRDFVRLECHFRVPRRFLQRSGSPRRGRDRLSNKEYEGCNRPGAGDDGCRGRGAFRTKVG